MVKKNKTKKKLGLVDYVQISNYFTKVYIPYTCETKKREEKKKKKTRNINSNEM